MRTLDGLVTIGLLFCPGIAAYCLGRIIGEKIVNGMTFLGIALMNAAAVLAIADYRRNKS